MNPHTIFELRRYRLLPEGREALIRLFDREFVEPQEALGMRVEAEFRDLDDPDSFVWVRSFKDMEARTEALASFYSGPVWKEHGPAANATMLNSDNVLLLKPPAGVDPFAHNLPRDAEAGRSRAKGLIIVNICSLAWNGRGFFQALPRPCAPAHSRGRCAHRWLVRDRAKQERLSQAAGSRGRDCVRLA